MKIADKIKYIIAHDHEVARRRAQLRALFYFQLKHPKKCYFRIHGGFCSTTIDLMIKDSFSDFSIGNINMSPLHSYPNYTDKLTHEAGAKDV